LYLGKLVEFNTTRELFERPHESLTENYITGRFG
jgi:ABC-type phosphate transport system ATPase subunit